MGFTYKDGLKMADPSGKMKAALDGYPALETEFNAKHKLYPIFAFKKQITEGAAGVSLITVPFDCEVIDVIVQAQGASANGTMTLTDGTSDITDAITCAVDKTVTRAGTIDDSKSSLSSGDTLEVDCDGDTAADTIGLITVLVIPS